jgi:hypothetical protein
LLSNSAIAQFATDVNNKFTNVGQLGLTVTNFGLIGNQFNKIDGKIQPSCLYGQHSEILLSLLTSDHIVARYFGNKQARIQP